ncbi:Tc1-mariner class Transposase [Phytophthora palmivora]|uniref:Tc1-mariner class Transposase n=1 Tax=Phytophthora palmivora TaxID=4796 RepID=A0A2P4YJY9_9STRA|nr:Tc1-mariner class Transposase [Phytophthora palmivora]
MDRLKQRYCSIFVDATFSCVRTLFYQLVVVMMYDLISDYIFQFVSMIKAVKDQFQPTEDWHTILTSSIDFPTGMVLETTPPDSSRAIQAHTNQLPNLHTEYKLDIRGERAIVRVPFARGERVSILAACDVNGFVAWRTTRGTFTRLAFNRAFVESVHLRLNPWPIPRSIVVLDNACIHMYPGLEAAIHSVGAVLLFLPPYCPQFNPIEIMFGQLKRCNRGEAEVE